MVEAGCLVSTEHGHMFFLIDGCLFREKELSWSLWDHRLMDENGFNGGMWFSFIWIYHLLIELLLVFLFLRYNLLDKFSCFYHEDLCMYWQLFGCILELQLWWSLKVSYFHTDDYWFHVKFGSMEAVETKILKRYSFLILIKMEYGNLKIKYLVSI